jgi:thiol-disulfide isomerase/thioredoxin
MLVDYDSGDIEDGIVRFTADWCVPCRSYASVYESAAERLDANFYVIDVEKHPELAEKQGVKSIPVVFKVKNGEWERFEHVPSLPELRDAVIDRPDSL